MFLSDALYAITIFLGSFLLFLVEPITAKRLLPMLGGSAAVWTTCLVFFQVALLLGYLCAHGLATRVGPRAQHLIYIGLLAASVAQAGMQLHPSQGASTAHPIYSVFRVLTVLIGLPFLVLAATNPLLQSWFSKDVRPLPRIGKSDSDHSTSVRSPYRLFALSNFGSLLALLLYPWLIEPRSSLHTQTLLWFAAFVIFAFACASIALLKARHHNPLAEKTTSGLRTEQEPSVSHRVLWLLLPACSSLLLCAITNHIVQDVAAAPLLWLVPLTMYLLSFVIPFSCGRWMPKLFRTRIAALGLSLGRMCVLCLAAAALEGTVLMLTNQGPEIPLIISLTFYSAALFFLCLFCHAELHRLRPSARYATYFYLMIAGGGALGSLFVGIGAPTLFSGCYELTCGLVAITLLILVVTWQLGHGWRMFWAIASVTVGVVLIYALVHEDQGSTLARVRNFYGSLRISEASSPPDNKLTRVLYNGTIIHGTEILDPQFRNLPTTYFGHQSGIGMALDFCCGNKARRVGIVGLGTGTLAAYGRTGDVFRFYDVNPLLESVAKDFFHYIRDSKARIEIVSGDGRLSLNSETPQGYDVLVIDAFTSDAIPVHLLTAEAMEVYRRHLGPLGIIAFHVSNRFLNLVPVVKQEAVNAGLQAAYISSNDEYSSGIYGADWVLVTANREFLSRAEVTKKTRADSSPPLRLWTDDYNSVVPILDWRLLKAQDTLH